MFVLRRSTRAYRLNPAAEERAPGSPLWCFNWWKLQKRTPVQPTNSSDFEKLRSMTMDMRKLQLRRQMHSSRGRRRRTMSNCLIRKGWKRPTVLFYIHLSFSKSFSSKQSPYFNSLETLYSMFPDLVETIRKPSLSCFFFFFLAHQFPI